MVRRHPVRTVWLFAQVLVVGFGMWGTTFGGSDYHIWFILLPAMAVLLFPGVVAPIVLLVDDCVEDPT